MKKCIFCETKKLRSKDRTSSRFLSRCDYCKNRELKILDEKRLTASNYPVNSYDWKRDVLERWIGGTGY